MQLRRLCDCGDVRRPRWLSGIDQRAGRLTRLERLRSRLGRAVVDWCDEILAGVPWREWLASLFATGIQEVESISSLITRLHASSPPRRAAVVRCRRRRFSL